MKSGIRLWLWLKVNQADVKGRKSISGETHARTRTHNSRQAHTFTPQFPRDSESRFVVASSSRSSAALTLRLFVAGRPAKLVIERVVAEVTMAIGRNAVALTGAPIPAAAALVVPPPGLAGPLGVHEWPLDVFGALVAVLASLAGAATTLVAFSELPSSSGGHEARGTSRPCKPPCHLADSCVSLRPT